jgi:hypothetical protein
MINEWGLVIDDEDVEGFARLLGGVDADNYYQSIITSTRIADTFQVLILRLTHSNTPLHFRLSHVPNC